MKFSNDLQQKEVNIPQSNPKRNGGDGLGETPSFVRNVMGSSAGAGSGEFHVYRHLRRKEYARQKQIQQQGVKVNYGKFSSRNENEPFESTVIWSSNINLTH